MNASNARREGENQYCDNGDPMDYFTRTGRNPPPYYLECYLEGWYKQEKYEIKKAKRLEEEYIESE